MTATSSQDETAGSGGSAGRSGRNPALSENALAAAFLADVAEPVRDQLAGSVGLRDFLRGAGTLTVQERRLLVDQALVLLEQNYVHLPLKVAMHAVNPVQRLRLLRIRLERQASGQLDPEWLFHTEMSEIFHSVRDLHTNYLLPSPFAGKVAFLPFRVEEFFDDSGGSHCVVSQVMQGFSAPGLEPGAEVTHWSGIPVARAIERNAARFAGSNAAARHARGLDSLTVRPLVTHLPPDEEWVTVSYHGTDGIERELRQKWLITENLPSFVGDLDEVSTTATALGLDLDGDEASRARTLLFVPQVAGQTQAAESPTLTAVAAAAGEDAPTSMPGVFRARSVATASGTFGHIRIFTFNVNDPVGFVEEFVRLIGLLPQHGLILDVRDNGGGHIFASEFTLQTLTPRRIVPEPVQFISTPLSARICSAHKNNPTGQIDLGPWFASLDQAAETGAPFSSAFPITPETGANDIGQQYHGPVVLITNARCYSATDIFAAGFQDHAIGPVLGVDDNTGAGGANVWTHGLLSALLQSAPGDSGSPYKPLPKGAGMRVSVRRTLRVGRLAGTPVEDLGVTPDVRHRMTRRDVLEGNVDLLEHAGRLLAGLPVRKLVADVHPSADGALRIELQVAGVDRADVYVDGRPRTSIDVAGIAGGSASVTVGDLPGARLVCVEGFSGGDLVAKRIVKLQASPGASPVSFREAAMSSAGQAPTVIYIHGAGNKPPRDDLKRTWDQDLFGRDMGQRTRMAHYADLLHAQPGAIGSDAGTPDEALAALAAATGEPLATLGEGSAGARAMAAEEAKLFAGLTPRGQALALRLSIDMATRAASQPLTLEDSVTGVLPLPPSVRRLLLRQLLQRLIPDADSYIFTDKRNAIQDRLRQALDAVAGPVVVVSHSLGTMIAYDVLSEPRFAGRAVPLLVTLGAPLGYTEIQDVIAKPLRIPPPVGLWANFADPLDVITLDTTLSDDFGGGPRIVDTQVDNPSPNNHDSGGYLRAPQVRSRVAAAVPAMSVG